MTAIGTVRIGCVALAAALLLDSPLAAATPPTPQIPEVTVFSQGVRARIEKGKLRSAKLEFGKSSLAIEQRNGEREEFAYDRLILQRGVHYRGAPLFERYFWYTQLLNAPILLATGGLHSAILQVSLSVGITNGLFFAQRRGSSHWLSLHAPTDHRCVFLQLPRRKSLRVAISEELLRRSKKELRVRPPPRLRRPGLPPIPIIGDIAPDFELPTLDGAPMRLSSLRGKVVLLNFWATWCGPCRKEMPHLQRLHEKYPEGRFALIGVVDEKPDEVREFLAEREITYPSLFDKAHDVFHRYGVTGIPMTAVIGPNGKIAALHEGYASERTLKKLLAPLMPQLVRR